MITPQRFVYSSLFVDDLGRLNRVLTSAVHADLASAARSAEINEPADRAIEWLAGVIDSTEWLIGLSVNHSPSTASAAHIAPRLIHPASATGDDIRRIWSQTRSSGTFLAEINDLRAERGLVQGPAPRFDLTPAPPAAAHYL
ncbi:hypothetical protein ACFUEJ_15010 [Gordonia sp. NPDC057258]|uniref:hypothetical protein n=1 Tax=unclassified Gordonia (in: high G+C Gram-positive bacteria) TaxID=2657482 RepID=UPI003636C027